MTVGFVVVDNASNLVIDSPLETAFDQEHPYYDGKSSRDKPKWHLVHVTFRRKFPDMIKLKELQKFSKDGGVLENMQAMKRSRLSVSRVSKKEWDFIISLVDIDDGTAADVANADGPGNLNSNGAPLAPPKDSEQNKEKINDEADLTTKVDNREGINALNASAAAASAPLGSSVAAASNGA